jgi:TM2 domain-containing membrane protein YozV
MLPLSEEKLEELEKSLKVDIQKLPQFTKAKYFNEFSNRVKDPDTYAVLNWLFLGGIHHFYLGRFITFGIEMTLLLISLSCYLAGFPVSLLILIAIAIYELPQLFFSQRIVREYNLNLSSKILEEQQLKQN